MRNRIIACFLSLTLAFNSFCPIFAFAEPLDEGTTLEETQAPEVVETELEEDLGEVVEPVETLDPESPEMREYSVSVSNGVMATDTDYGVMTADTDSILDVIRSYVIGLFDFAADTYSSVKKIFETVGDLRVYTKKISDINLDSAVRYDGMDLSYMTYYVAERLRYKDSDGKDFSAARMLFDIRNYLEYEGYDISYLMYYTAERLRYKDADGNDYSAARLLYDISQSLSYNGYDAGYMLYHIAERLRDSSENNVTIGQSTYNSWLLLQELVEFLTDPENSNDVTVEVPEVNVTVDPGQELTSEFDLFTLVFGALEFTLIASSLADLDDTLETTFPFSLVAGFVAIIGLLQADPVAPCFDFPVPDGVGGEIVYTVDLSVFDPVAQACRLLMTIIFCLGLISVTRNFIFKGGSGE